MGITRSKLLSLARSEAERRAAKGDVVSGYVIGSVAADEPLLGGTADIDLVLIHETQPDRCREMVPLSEQIHLDIVHHSTSLYAQPRELRVHPWLGPSMCEPAFLYDPDHFFEWAQAGVRGQFFRADYRHTRGLAFLRRARRRMQALGSNAGWLPEYLEAVLEGANAIASLAGFPAAGRRLALKMEAGLAELNRSDIYAAYLGLLQVDGLPRRELPAWLSAWARAFDAASAISPEAELDPCRRDYHLTGFQTMVEAECAAAAIWPMLHTWSQALAALDLAGQAEPHLAAYHAALEALQLAEAHRPHRQRQLEAFLDGVEAALEAWAEHAGA